MNGENEIRPGGRNLRLQLLLLLHRDCSCCCSCCCCCCLQPEEQEERRRRIIAPGAAQHQHPQHHNNNNNNSNNMSLGSRLYATNMTTPPPHISGDAAVGYVLVPFVLVTVVGIAAAVIMYIRRRQRIDRLRHQLLPVYTYDPSEELNEVEQELLWKDEDTKVVQGWARSYQQRRPLLGKDVNA